MSTLDLFITLVAIGVVSFTCSMAGIYVGGVAMATAVKKLIDDGR